MTTPIDHYLHIESSALKIPDKFSALIRETVRMTSRLNRGKYTPCSDTWHDGTAVGHGRCFVCLVGARVSSLINEDINWKPPTFQSDATYNKLLALESLRSESVRVAVAEFYPHLKINAKVNNALKQIDEVPVSSWNSWEEWDDEVAPTLLYVANVLEEYNL